MCVLFVQHSTIYLCIYSFTHPAGACAFISPCCVYCAALHNAPCVESALCCTALRYFIQTQRHRGVLVYVRFVRLVASNVLHCTMYPVSCTLHSSSRPRGHGLGPVRALWMSGLAAHGRLRRADRDAASPWAPREEMFGIVSMMAGTCWMSGNASPPTAD